MAATDTRYGELCRLCASKTDIIIALNIYGDEGAIRQIDQKIETCLPVKIHEADELPKMICENCLYKLDLFCEFRDRAVRTQNLLIDLYKELNANKVQNEQQQQMVKMNIVSIEQHPELIMVEPHHELLNDNIENVDLDLAPLSHRDNIIVGQEIILSHQDINSHTLHNINLNHHDLSNHSLQGPNTILVDENGSVHTMSSVRYTSANLELIRDEQIFSEQFRLQQRLQMELTNPPRNHINETMHVTPKEEQTNVKDCTENQIVSPINSIHTTSPPSEILEKDSLHVEPNYNDAKQLEECSETNDNIVNNQHSVKLEKDWIYCNICGSAFNNKEEFQLHCDQHLQIYKCEECFVAFPDQIALSSHVKEVHEARIEEYDKVTPNDESTTQEPVKSIRDDSESEEGHDLNGVDDEEDEDDPGPELADSGGTSRKTWSPKVCAECGKSYKTNYKLTEHMRKHTGEKPYKCKSCEKEFRSKIGLAQHEAKHTGQYDYSCPTCGKGFQCKSYLMVHQRAHSDAKPFPCTTCGRNFKTKQSLLDHTNRHLGLKPYICDICGRGFITKGLCRAHQKVHSGTDNRKYSCNICSKRFVSKSYLQTHYRIHTGEKPFMCEVCGKGFLTRVDLRIHSTMHTGEKSYVCEMCGKAFARRDALRCHRRSHTGERPYSCDQCGQTFTQFSPMAIHKRLHTGERPYVCEVCGRRFVSRSTMMAHSKKHVRKSEII